MSSVLRDMGFAQPSCLVMLYVSKVGFDTACLHCLHARLLLVGLGNECARLSLE